MSRRNVSPPDWVRIQLLDKTTSKTKQTAKGEVLMRNSPSLWARMRVFTSAQALILLLECNFSYFGPTFYWSLDQDTPLANLYNTPTLYNTRVRRCVLSLWVTPITT